MEIPKALFKNITILILLIAPINFFVLGQDLGNGIQWAFFRYQGTGFGNIIITVVDELYYVSSGLIQGKSAISLIVWIIASILLLAAYLFSFFCLIEKKSCNETKEGLIIIAIGVLFLISLMFHYGPILSGAAGFCVPTGIPLIWAVGFLIMQRYFQDGDLSSSSDSAAINETSHEMNEIRD